MASVPSTTLRRRLTFSFSAMALVAFAACVSEDPAAGTAGGDGGPALGGDGSMSDLDGTTGGDGSSGDGSACTPACVDTGAALGCGATKTVCAFGCAAPTATATAHCRVFDPTGAVDATDLAQLGLKDFAGKDLKFFTDTGRITSADEATELRPANAVAVTEEVSANGIGFRLVAGKIGIFQFKNFTLQANTTFESNSAFGTVALAIVAAEEVTINGKLDVGCSGRVINYYPAAARFEGAAAPANNMTQVDGNGPGGGHAGAKATSGTTTGQVMGGGGGAGHATAGGQGGDGLATSGPTVFGGNGGAAYDDGSFDPPLGGSGGGAGTGGNNGGAGGAGGGAVQIVAGKRITIGDGAGTDAGVFGLAQGINAGGCAGGSSFGGAGGGGSGGSIILESLEVVGRANAGVASNGGGGGGGYDGQENGTISTTPAAGAPVINCSSGPQGFGSGGSGGAGSTPSGTKGTPPSGCSGKMIWGGGGGGSVGRVRINTSGGAFTADPKFVVSPSVAPALQQGTIATR